MRQEKLELHREGRNMSTIRVRRGVLASSMALALFAPHAFAQTSTTSSSDQQATQQSTSSSAQPADQKSAAKQLQAITVTRSLIPRVEIEGPAPVVTITGEEIKQQGFTMLYEFLDSLPQMGKTQDPAGWGSTSVNARSVN